MSNYYAYLGTGALGSLESEGVYFTCPTDSGAVHTCLFVQGWRNSVFRLYRYEDRHDRLTWVLVARTTKRPFQDPSFRVVPNDYDMEHFVCMGRQRVTLPIPGRVLRAVFGPPGSWGDSAPQHWTFMEDGDCPTWRMSLYSYDCDPHEDDPYQWHIGACSQVRAAAFYEWLYDQIPLKALEDARALRQVPGGDPQTPDFVPF